MILTVVVLGVIILSITQSWFNKGTAAPETIITPEAASEVQPSQIVLSSCSQVCSEQGFSKSYSKITTCRAGESEITYGYIGQLPLLKCCCN